MQPSRLDSFYVPFQIVKRPESSLEPFTLLPRWRWSLTEAENFRVCPPLIFYFFAFSAIVRRLLFPTAVVAGRGRSAIFYRGGGRTQRVSLLGGRQVSTVHVDRGASNKECSSRTAGKGRRPGPEGEEPLTGTHVPIPYMGTHCERNRVPHERYILPSQPTAPFRDVAFHIAAVSPLVPIADRYRLTYARARADSVSSTSFLRSSIPNVLKTATLRGDSLFFL